VTINSGSVSAFFNLSSKEAFASKPAFKELVDSTNSCYNFFISEVEPLEISVPRTQVKTRAQVCISKHATTSSSDEAEAITSISIVVKDSSEACDFGCSCVG